MNYFLVGKAVVLPILLFLLYNPICFPAEWIEQGVPSPFSGILISPSSAQKIIDTEKLLKVTEETILKLETSIKIYEEIESLTTIKLNNLNLQIEDLKKQNEELRNSQGWNFLRYGIGFILGAGSMYGIYQILK
jgi:hypothetical protein